MSASLQRVSGWPSLRSQGWTSRVSPSQFHKGQLSFKQRNESLFPHRNQSTCVILKEAPLAEEVVALKSAPKPVQTFASPVSHPTFLAAGLICYSLVAYDVFSPDSQHLLQPIDQALHQTTLSIIDPAVRKHLFGGVLSNGPTIAASIGWIFTTATALSRNNPLAWKACALAWALWIFGVGPIEHDPALMDVLKTSFGRARPSPIHRTASFPSGHTASDVLCVGALLFVLLPVVFGGDGARGGKGTAGREEGSREGAGPHALFKVLYDVQHSWALWALSAGVTIVGRVGVDAHWLSDTLAAAGLGLALVSGLANATERLAKSEQAADTDAAAAAAATVPAAASPAEERE